MIPGRILVVDDKKGEVADLIDQFTKRGEHAVYWPVPVEGEYYEDIRLLIFDYWVFEDSESDSLRTITEIVNSSFQKSKFFMIVIWSAKVTKENKTEYKNNLLEAYRKRYDGTEMPGVLLEPISRDELDYLKLIEKIDDEIANYSELNLLYEVEKIFGNAKNKVGAQIYGIGSWSNLIRELSREYDVESVERMLLSMYFNMLRRNAVTTEEFKRCVQKLKGDLPPRVFSDVDFGKVYSSQYYCQVSKNEQIGTGDVLYNKKSKDYYMVITPECDITNDKHTATKLIEAVRIEHTKLGDQDYVKGVADSYGLKETNGSVIPSKVINAIMYGDMKKNFCPLLFLRENVDFFHLIFDFHKVKSVKKAKKMTDLKGYKRLCRVDSPLLNSFIQQYAFHCSRFGTISIPEELSKSLSSRLPRRIPANH
jgi:hypothetical protein